MDAAKLGKSVGLADKASLKSVAKLSEGVNKLGNALSDEVVGTKLGASVIIALGASVRIN
jgi:hypothetical protein